MQVPVRPLYNHRDLDRLINPKTIAVVGASETRGSFGERTLTNLSAFKGNVYAVNPKYKELLGRPCVPSLAELPEVPDCVILCGRSDRLCLRFWRDRSSRSYCGPGASRRGR